LGRAWKKHKTGKGHFLYLVQKSGWYEGRETRSAGAKNIKKAPGFRKDLGSWGGKLILEMRGPSKKRGGTKCGGFFYKTGKKKKRRPHKEKKKTTKRGEAPLLLSNKNAGAYPSREKL